MKILMRNVGMTLHVIHKLRAQGIDNVKVNMDWQHLIMNGENLAEYAAMLAAEGLLGHQHANSGWGTFDDDNMVGATAFMETLELAVELRRAGYGENGERLGFDLYPYTEDAVAAVRRSVLQWRFIDSVAAKIDDAALREAQMRKDAVRAYELVYAALGGAPMTALVGLDVGTTGVKALAITPDGEVVASAEEGYGLPTPQPGWSEQDPEDWWRASESALARLGVEPSPSRPLGSDARARLPRRARDASSGRRSSGTTSARRPSAPRSRSCVGLERLIALTGNRALPGFTAPKLLWLRRHEPDVYARIHRIVLPKDYVRLRLTGEWAIDAADASGTLLFDVGQPALVRRGAGRARHPGRVAPARQRVDRDRRRRRPAGRGARRRRHRAGHGLGRPRHLGRRARRAPRVRARLRGPASMRSAMPRRSIWEAMGVMLNAAGALQWFRDALAPGVSFDELTAEAAQLGAGGGGAASSSPTSRANGLHTPTPTREASFTGLSLRHDRGALVRAVLEGVAYGLRDSLELLRELGVAPEAGRVVRRRRAQPALAGDRRLRARPPARAPRRRGGVGLRRRAARRRRRRHVRGRARGGRGMRPRPRDGRAEPCAGRRRTRRVTLAFARCIPPSEEWRSSMTSSTGKVAFVTGASRGIGAAVARALSDAGVSARARVAQRRRPRAPERARARLRRPRPRAGRGVPSRRPSSASAASTSASRTPASARTTRSWTRPSSTSRR